MATRAKSITADPKPRDPNRIYADEPVPTDPKQLAEKLRARFTEEAVKLADTTDPQAFVQAIIKDLQQEKEAVILRLLGVKKDYDGWRVDNYSNHKSLVVDLLDDEAKATVKRWVNSAVKEALTEETKNKLITQARGAIKRQVEDLVRDAANGWSIRKALEPNVEEILRRAADELRKEMNLPLPIERKTDRY